MSETREIQFIVTLGVNDQGEAPDTIHVIKVLADAAPRLATEGVRLLYVNAEHVERVPDFPESRR